MRYLYKRLNMKHLRHLVLPCLALMLGGLASCRSSQESLTYFTDVERIESTPVGDYQIRIEPNDEIGICVTSDNPSATAQFNISPPISQVAMGIQYTSQMPEYSKYIVDTKGNIDFPVLGRIHVAGLTLEQLRDKIQAEVSKEVANPIVRVTILNYTVYVAGEVLTPGQYTSEKQRFTVLDALSSAGDLTVYGRRDNVLVIREIDGKRVTARLDLNKAETLTSPFFYLKQNDYVYVEPTKARQGSAEYNTNNSYKLSVVSTIVSGCSVIASLIIALLVR